MHSSVRAISVNGSSNRHSHGGRLADVWGRSYTLRINYRTSHQISDLILARLVAVAMNRSPGSGRREPAHPRLRLRFFRA
jgi:hypothetical protein